MVYIKQHPVQPAWKAPNIVKDAKGTLDYTLITLVITSNNQYVGGLQPSGQVDILDRMLQPSAWQAIELILPAVEVIAPGLTVNAGLVLTHSGMEGSCHLSHQ